MCHGVYRRRRSWRSDCRWSDRDWRTGWVRVWVERVENVESVESVESVEKVKSVENVERVERVVR